MISKKSGWIAAAAVVALGLGAGITIRWRAQERAASILVEHLPAQPALRDKPQEMIRTIGTCEDLVRRGPDRLDALSTLAQLYHANGFFAEAISAYRGVIAADDADLKSKHRLATVFASYGQADEALLLWKDVIDGDPSYLPARIKHADGMLKLGREAEAKNAYEDILEDDTANPYAIVGLARIEVRSRNWQAAKVLLEERLPAENGHIGNDLLGTVYTQLGLNYRQSLRNRGSGIYLEPADPWMEDVYEYCYDAFRLNLLAGDANMRGDSAKALRRLEKAARYAPQSAAAQFQLGMFFVQRRQNETAEPHFKRCLELSPDFADAYIQLRTIYATRGNTAAANQMLEAGLRNCPRSPGLLIEKGRALAAEGRRAEAEKAFSESIKMRPEEAAAYVEIARLHIQADNTAEGIRWLQESLKAEPGYPVTLSILAMHWIIEGDRPRAEQAMSAVARQPRIDEANRQGLIRAFREKFQAAPPLL